MIAGLKHAPLAALVRSDRRARAFLAVHAQSALGTGAAYVALLLVAHERGGSRWAVPLVLLADFLPAMLLGALLGAACDAWPRRRCLVVADVLRAGAFAGLAFADGLGPLVALALVAGLGTALGLPATLAGLPELVERPMLAAATSAVGALSTLGQTLGPVLAAGALLLVAPSALLAVNAATFALSALVVGRLRFAPAPAEPDAPVPALGARARQELASAARPGPLRVLVGVGAAVAFFAGMLNVAEPLLATEQLQAGASGFAVLVAAWGSGVTAGAAHGASATAPAGMRRSYLVGLAALAAGLVGLALAPALGLAALASLVGGVGNGLVLTHERLLVQAVVPEARLGSVFGIVDSAGAWGLGLAFLAAGALVAVAGVRELVLVAGLGSALVWAWALVGLRVLDPVAEPAARPEAAVA